MYVSIITTIVSYEINLFTLSTSPRISSTLPLKYMNTKHYEKEMCKMEKSYFMVTVTTIYMN